MNELGEIIDFINIHKGFHYIDFQNLRVEEKKEFNKTTQKPFNFFLVEIDFKEENEVEYVDSVFNFIQIFEPSFKVFRKRLVWGLKRLTFCIKRREGSNI